MVALRRARAARTLYALAVGDASGAPRVDGRLLRAAARHKVSTAVLRTLERAGLADRVDDAARALSEWFAERGATYEAELRALEAARPVRAVMVFRGPAIARWYPAGTPRQSGDLDLAVSTGDLWALHRWLVARGWNDVGMIAVRARSDPPDTLAYAFTLAREDLASAPQIDLMAELAAGGWCGCLALQPMLDRAREMGGREAAVRHPGLVDCIVAVLFDMCERRLVVRDAVDLEMLVGRALDDGGLDVREVVDAAVSQGLALQLWRVVHLHRAVCPEPGAGRWPPLLERLRPWVRAGRMLSAAAWLGSAAGHVLERQGWRRAALDARLAAVDRLRSTAVGGSALSALSSPTSAAIACDRWTRMLQLCTHEGGVVQVRRRERGPAFLDTPAGTFVATRSTTFTERFVRSAQRTAAQLFDHPCE